MTRRDLVDLLLLGAIWGASFLFMRLGAAEFGPVALAFVRVAGAAALLVPLMLLRRQGAAWRKHGAAIAGVGVVNSALPFVLYAVAALALTTALMSVFNATVSIWAALIAWLWLKERLDPLRWLGLAIGVVGVVGLSWGKADFRPGEHGVSAAAGVAACLAATWLYGLGANVSRRRLQGVPPLAVAAGSQAAAALALAVPGLWLWPAKPPGATAWAAALALSLLCTGLAYILYFRLLARTSAASATSVTFLIPPFALLWGYVALGEVPTGAMLAGCAVILLGTALATGLLRRPG
ncbi:MAG: DMT family transporter [Betaproteobacteria bacterium]|jgi:drug/metabolite transporter (DMT)-like permease|nr:DMT family transporter [Rubrivivax sp.]